MPSSATGLRRTSRAKVAKNNSEFIYYSKYKEIGSATSSNQPESASLLTKKASGKVSKVRKSCTDAGTAKQRSAQREQEPVGAKEPLCKGLPHAVSTMDRSNDCHSAITPEEANASKKHSDENKESLPMGAAFPSYASQSDADINFEKLIPKKTKSNLPLNHESKYIEKTFSNFQISTLFGSSPYRRTWSWSSLCCTRLFLLI